MVKYLFVILNLLIFSDIFSKENWVWVLEAHYSTFNERIDLYVDPSSMRGIGQNLITYDEIFIPKKIVMYQGSLIGAMKNKMVANCKNLKSKQIQIDLFSDFEATKLFDSAKEKDPNSPLYPTQNPDQRLKKYCQFLNEGSIRMKKDGNKTVFVNKQNENFSTDLEKKIQKPKTTLRSSEQNNKKDKITKTNNKKVKYSRKDLDLIIEIFSFYLVGFLVSLPGYLLCFWKWHGRQVKVDFYRNHIPIFVSLSFYVMSLILDNDAFKWYFYLYIFIYFFWLIAIFSGQKKDKRTKTGLQKGEQRYAIRDRLSDLFYLFHHVIFTLSLYGLMY